MTATLDYDLVLKHIGQCRAWQWRNFFLLWLTSGAGGLAVVVWAFTAFNMPARCPVSLCDTQGAESPWMSGAHVGANKELDGTCTYLAPGSLESKPNSCDAYTRAVNDTTLKKLGDGVEKTGCSQEQLIFNTDTTTTR